MTKGRKGECAYCGRVTRLTEDHVPPKGLFGKPQPSDLIKVPSCFTCNMEASLDDEYFRTVIVLKDRAGSHPEAAMIRASVFRALANVRKRGFARAILSQTRSVLLRTPAGLHVGRRLAFDVDLQRLDRVVARVTKGLFWYHEGRRLPDGMEVTTFSEDGLREVTTAEISRMQENIIGPALSQPIHSIGRGALRYWYTHASDAPNVSVWIYEFHGDVRFLALTLPGAGRTSA
jgi:hypothetical protein